MAETAEAETYRSETYCSKPPETVAAPCKT
jgi:hypothetical protein